MHEMWLRDIMELVLPSAFTEKVKSCLFLILSPHGGVGLDDL